MFFKLIYNIRAFLLNIYIIKSIKDYKNIFRIRSVFRKKNIRFVFENYINKKFLFSNITPVLIALKKHFVNGHDIPIKFKIIIIGIYIYNNS